MLYDKPVTTFTQQIHKLRDRGLEIADEAVAEHYLKNVGYYRLAGYWWPMYEEPKVNHVFKPNSRFSDIISLYNFDRELRLLLFDVIERIEVALRTKMIYHLSHDHGFWWFQDQNLFINTKELVKTLAGIEESLEISKDAFIKEHKKKYKDDGRFPPAMKTLEITTFGSLSKLYGNLKNNVRAKDTIADEFQTVNHTYLPSWLQSIAQIRNICAHHGRLWNKNLPGRPHLMSKPPGKWIESVPPAEKHHLLYIHLCCLKYLLNSCSPGNRFTVRLTKILESHPNVDPAALGLSPGWSEEPLWET